jgi:DNA-binding transcriptional MerR regulator
MSSGLSIGDLARATGTNVQTIRYYESVGLLEEPIRTSGNQRRYDKKAEQRLAFIRHSRELGFSIDAIRELLTLSGRPELSCARVDEIARYQIDEIESRIARLESLKTELGRMVRQCRHGKVSQCRIIEVLADHALCESTHDGAAEPKGVRKKR